jgi:hypothetical protein
VTKNEIIVKTLKDLGLPRSPKHGVPFPDEPDEEEIVIAELASILPDTDIKTCSDFKQPKVACCDTCHHFYPHYDMSLIELPSGDKAWVCCSVRSVLHANCDKQSSKERTKE